MVLNKLKVLIVDDEAAIRDMVAMSLELSGFGCIQAENGSDALALIVDEKPDLALVDWMMPEMTGIELTRRLRREGTLNEMPVILLTAKAEEDNKISGLESGADDYITKPFSPRELIARIKSTLRRAGKLDVERSISVADLVIDPASQRVKIGEQTLKLGPIEYRLLYYFATHQDRVHSREQLLDKVWGANVYVEERTVDVHIRRLRKALSVDGHEDLIETVRGSGYLFNSKLTTE
ncbi:MAG: phosphate regulon transcriptional regulator PhoB [Pseudomonadales bacterium]|jgi:two-component system phosphate regulon response regulator PhoB